MAGTFVKVGLVAGGLAAISCVTGVQVCVSKTWATPLGWFGASDNDPFEQWLAQERKHHDDFVATAECRKKLAELQAFWADEGIAGASVQLPASCIKKS